MYRMIRMIWDWLEDRHYVLNRLGRSGIIVLAFGAMGYFLSSSALGDSLDGMCSSQQAMIEHPPRT